MKNCIGGKELFAKRSISGVIVIILSVVAALTFKKLMNLKTDFRFANHWDLNI